MASGPAEMEAHLLPLLDKAVLPLFVQVAFEQHSSLVHDTRRQYRDVSGEEGDRERYQRGLQA
eukprot:298416-Rhodomonas_salina.2